MLENKRSESLLVLGWLRILLSSPVRLLCTSQSLQIAAPCLLSAGVGGVVFGGTDRMEVLTPAH